MLRAPSRNKPLEAHQRQFSNRPIGSHQLVGVNPPKRKFPRHGRWRPPVKRTWYRQANNGFMIMGQPTPQPQLGIEAITKIIAGIQMREPVRANAIQNIPTVNETANIQRNFEQMFSAINELRDSQETLLARDEHVYPAFSVDTSLTGSGSPSSYGTPGEWDDIGYGEGVRPERDQDRADTASNPSIDDSIQEESTMGSGGGMFVTQQYKDKVEDEENDDYDLALGFESLTVSPQPL